MRGRILLKNSAQTGQGCGKVDEICSMKVSNVKSRHLPTVCEEIGFVSVKLFKSKGPMLCFMQALKPAAGLS